MAESTTVSNMDQFPTSQSSSSYSPLCVGYDKLYAKSYHFDFLLGSKAEDRSSWTVNWFIERNIIGEMKEHDKALQLSSANIITVSKQRTSYSFERIHGLRHTLLTLLSCFDPSVKPILAEMRRLLSDRKSLRKLPLIAVVASGSNDSLGGWSRIRAFNKLPVTNLMLRRSGAIRSEFNIRNESVEGPKIDFVGDKSTVGDFLADAAMKSQKE
ncbi:uncharacterized protein EAE98_003154 [Botrytis deweyae]|uniref:Uncharacterized protein n=1 Tax=Botrytis deweyae TaxID=2478750 RepID=A0ABQ7IVT9_9HELO|nr:uncharacterized protein EAE98_003154 [Botrytis deweyae]KAF7935109.1 hypothetical protein EAE98_003154 [Botrytis deweyae]